MICLVGLSLLLACTKMPSRQQATDEKFSDDELKKFAAIYHYLRLRPQENPEIAVKKAVEQSSLSEARFGEIMRAKFTQQHIKITPNEQKALMTIRNSIKQTQMTQKKQDEQVIISRGMTLERYYTILKAYKQSTFLQNRIYELMQAKK